MASVPETMEGIVPNYSREFHLDNSPPGQQHSEGVNAENTHASHQALVVGQMVRQVVREEIGQLSSRFQAFADSSQTGGESVPEPSSRDINGAHSGLLEEQQRKLEDQKRKLSELQLVVQEKDTKLQKREREVEDLARQLTESQATLAKMKKIMVLAGRKEAKPMDNDIIQKFITLKSDILQIVRSHLLRLTVMPKGVKAEDAAPELSELIIRGKIANLLWMHFFDPKILLFGLDDDQPYNTMKLVEEGLLKMGRNTDELVDWRNSSIRIIRSMEIPASKRYPLEKAKRIWEKIETYCHYDRKEVASRQGLMKDLENLCFTAYEAALLFRETKIEYRWEQQSYSDDPISASPRDHEIAATLGPDPTEPHEIERVVFGGVVRGDRKTGRFSDGRTRLTQTTVIIASPSNAPMAHR